MGYPTPSSQLGFVIETGSNQTFRIDSVYTWNSAGDVIGIKTPAPTVSNKTVKLFMHCDAKVEAVAGNLDNLFEAEIREAAASGGSDDNDRPRVTGGSVIATSATVTPVNDTWAEFVFSNVTLTEGLTYYFIVYGKTGVDASNYVNWCARRIAGLDSINFGAQWRGFTNTTGFASTDAGLTTNPASGVVVFNAGESDEMILGNPMVDSSTQSNNDWQGNRYNFPCDVEATGCSFPGKTSSGTAEFAIYQGSTEIIKKTLDRGQQSNGEGITFSPITLSANTDYDFVTKSSATSATGSTRYSMGPNTVPTEVIGALQGVGMVTGSTPGSFTFDDEKLYGPLHPFGQLIASSGGAGGGLITHPGMSGGMRG